MAASGKDLPQDFFEVLKRQPTGTDEVMESRNGRDPSSFIRDAVLRR